MHDVLGAGNALAIFYEQVPHHGCGTVAVAVRFEAPYCSGGAFNG